MEMEQIFLQRLKNARVMNGYSYKDFAEALDNRVSAQTLRNYENGVSFPKSDVMNAMLRVLHIKIDTLFRPFTVDWSVVKFDFRKKNRMSDTQFNELMLQVQDKAERYVELAEIMSMPTVANECISQCRINSIYSADGARSIGVCARRCLGLGNEPIANMQEVVERMGAKLLPVLADESFDGVHFMCHDHIFICYNSALDNVERLRFTIAHELGHLLLNIPDSVGDKGVEELCNAFASEFLLPSSKLYELLGENRKNIALQELKNIQSLYGISVDAIMQAACDLNIISENRLNTYFSLKNKGIIDRDKVDKSVFVERGTDRFDNLVYRALSSEIISLSKAAYLLNKDTKEVAENIAFV